MSKMDSVVRQRKARTLPSYILHLLIWKCLLIVFDCIKYYLLVLVKKYIIVLKVSIAIVWVICVYIGQLLKEMFRVHFFNHPA